MEASEEIHLLDFICYRKNISSRNTPRTEIGIYSQNWIIKKQPENFIKMEILYNAMIKANPHDFKRVIRSRKLFLDTPWR